MQIIKIFNNKINNLLLNILNDNIKYSLKNNIKIYDIKSL